MNIEMLFRSMTERNASDLHIATGMPPLLRVLGGLESLDHPVVTQEDFETLVEQMLTGSQRVKYLEDLEIDFAFSYMQRQRLRAAFYRYMNGSAAAFRMIPDELVELDRLGLPPVVKDFARKESGLVLAVGPTGCGKSTTLASMVDLINRERKCHVITIEDPIEFVHTNKVSFITQREIDTHTRTFSSALRSALREDPDVIMVGELRDLETIHLALTAAETGHMVLATIHANSASECIDRIISAFPSDQQSVVRIMLSNTLVGIIYQALIPRADGKARVCASEVLVGTHAMRNIIREDKTHQLPSLMQTGIKDGMRSLDQSLRELEMKRLISSSEAAKRMKPKISIAQTVR
ncbi:MAG: PilT/PilU family type 4a pilus ATPase [Nitrospiraceae bacterium]|nr:PilT/PilU family type 4a pilus ATPase [Nitrospiraceae bacterium]